MSVLPSEELDRTDEIQSLRRQIAELERRLTDGAAEDRKAEIDPAAHSSYFAAGGGDLQVVVDGGSVFAWAIDLERRFTLAAGNGLAALGLKSADVVGQELEAVFGDTPQVLEGARRALAGHSCRALVRVRDVAFDAYCAPQYDEAGRIVGALGVAADISRFDRAARALRVDRDFMSAVLDSIETLITILDVEGRVLFLNRATELMSGHVAQKATGKFIWDLFPKLQAERAKRAVAQVLAGRVDQDLKYFEVQRDGQVRTLEWSAQVLPTGDGAAQSIVVWAVDITERAANEERLRQIVQNMPVMLVAVEQKVDLTTDAPIIQVVAWNSECERVTGYTAAEVVGNPKAFELLYPDPDYRLQMIGEWREMEDHFRDIEWTLTAKDGTPKTIAWSNLSALFPISGWGSWAVGIDVTQRSQAQAELQAAHEGLEARVAERTGELLDANEQLRKEVQTRHEVQRELVRQTQILQSILSSIGEGVVVAGRDGRFTVFNPAASRILGVGRLDVPVSEWSRRYGLYLPDRVTPYPENELPLVRASRGEVPPDTEVYVQHADRQEGVWLSVIARPVRDDNGTLVGGVAVFRDITESKRAGAALAAEQKLLQRLLVAHERDRQLIAYEIHDGFLQDVTGALMHLESYRRLRSMDPDSAKGEFDLALRLLRDSLGEGRGLISGLRPPIIDEQGIVAAIDYLISEQTSAGAGCIEFRPDVSSRRFSAIVEGTIYRIVQEALNNIRRHSKATYTVVDLVEEAGTLRVEIRDNGVGFDPLVITENRFGLQGIRERARLLRGRASIESQLGQGTRVCVELPATPPQEVADPRSDE
ncbi:MAG: PAS domain S-box protein [Pirellulales bacterium]|nr:PAS domain S-box protein [Pirellulales bacterium]